MRKSSRTSRRALSIRETRKDQWMVHRKKEKKKKNQKYKENRKEDGTEKDK